ncbi:TPA: hypothetical protein SI347_004718 [Escherichia coli]|nr:hypothetical protein [Escherichia coli]
MNRADLEYTGRVIQRLRENNFLSEIYINLATAALDKGDPVLCKQLLARQKEIERQGDVLANEMRAFFGEKVKE